MRTPIEVFLAVAAIGGKLSIVEDRLRMGLPSNCSPALKGAIRQQKGGLLALLPLSFLAVRSDILNETVFWVPDAHTKEALSFAGAEACNIYTVAELEALVSSRITADQFPLVHRAKRCFNGQIRRSTDE